MPGVQAFPAQMQQLPHPPTPCQSCHSELKSNVGSVSNDCAFLAGFHCSWDLHGPQLGRLWCREREVYICITSRKAPFDSMTRDLTNSV